MGEGGSIRVGVIGVGSVAQAAHIPNLKALGATIVAIADIVEERAKRVAEGQGIPYAFRDYRQLLRRDDIDAVIVSVPTYLHFPIVTASLKAGKHVLCEKPPAMTLRQAEKMAELSDETGLVLMYGLQLRYRHDSRALKGFVEKGELGEVYYGRAVYLRRRGAPGGWFAHKKLSGGGPLADLGVHMLDLTWWLMGRPKPTSAVAFTFRKIGTKGVRLNQGWQPADVREGREREVIYDVEDFAGGFVRFENEAVITFEISWQLNIQGDYWGVTLCGDKAGASFPPLRLYSELFGEGVTVNLKVDAGNAYLEEIREFLSCIRERRRPLTNAWDGVVVTGMLDALYRSAERKREIPIRV